MISLNGIDERVLAVLRADPQHHREVQEALPDDINLNMLATSLLRLREAKLVTMSSNGMIRRIDGEGKARVTVTATFEFDLHEWANEYGQNPEETEDVMNDVQSFLATYLSEPHNLLKLIGHVK